MSGAGHARIDTSAARTLAGLLTDARISLTAHGIEDSALESEVLLADTLGCGRAYLHAHADDACDAGTERLFRSRLDRRLRGEPLAYLLGRREFWSFNLAVNCRVLIPRPETELLVERTLQVVTRKQAEVLDLGTGSGAIACALARERPRWRVWAADVSVQALAVAQDNARALHLSNLRFRRPGRWFDTCRGLRFDAVVCNPPYVSAIEPALRQLRYEPRGALVSARDGYADLYELVRAARAALRPGGVLLLEHGATQGQRVRKAMRRHGYRRVAGSRDLAGRDRVSLGYQPSRRS